MTHNFKPGDVARIRLNNGFVHPVAIRLPLHEGGWATGTSKYIHSVHVAEAHPLVVISPEDREQVERFLEIASRWADDVPYDEGPGDLNYTTAMQAALREFAHPKQSEPTDPKAQVTDCRENIWRLLADGEWVCTSGPDIGECLGWDRLAAERGPLEVTA
jgi:hypothetical protein